ncbi:BTB/POZ domain-containing protein 17-like [Scyliorhinus canicula]|uniref:BTB/POZ domain-containing protein 17-like n=1 Tax=Scyliorhinus canicula TaxID=7830 RepID=UPI0018F648D0|nr:BTB/POZ domain-containing protein 17-like [Scyliorhinus canicula]XP_038644138.1 BTB/POZ domain-containing protein 17-like [Scyliorhinus canicula]
MMDVTGPLESLDHQTSFVNTLSALFNKEDFSDTKLIVNKKLTLNAHKFILVVRSDVFRTLLDTERWLDAKDQTVHLTEEEDCLDHFQDFLRYLYNRSVTLSTVNVLPLHLLSEKYNVQELRESCQQFMLANVAALGSSNRAITWQRYAKLTGLTQLEEKCLRFIAWNIGTIIKSPGWTSMEPHQLSALLQSSDLVVEDEVVLFQALVSWLSLHPAHTVEMLQHIRYPMMPPEKLYDLQARGSLPDAISTYLHRESLLVYQVHLLPTDAISQHHDITTIPFTMRLYTSESFSHAWDIKGYDNMGKTSIPASLSSSNFKLKTQWSVTFSPKGQRTLIKRLNVNCMNFDNVWQDDDFSTLSALVSNCDPAGKTHSHKLSILLYRCVNGVWFVNDTKSLEVPHSRNAQIKDLIPLSEREKYVSNDTMKLHLIGQTIWEKCQ